MATYIRSVDGKVQVEIEPGSPATLLPNIGAQGIQKEIDDLEQAITTYRGQPVVVADAADMDDELTIYLYMGSESGYNANHWYYYDGTEWVDGGEYVANPVIIDDTLTQSGGAADAKVTGDEISALKADLNDVCNYEDIVLWNLIDIDKIHDGGMVNDGGNISTSFTEWSYTDFIEVKPSTTYTQFSNSGTDSEISGGVYIAQYQADNTFISRSGGNKLTITTAENCKYVRLSVKTAGKNLLCFGAQTLRLYAPVKFYNKRAFAINAVAWKSGYAVLTSGSNIVRFNSDSWKTTEYIYLNKGIYYVTPTTSGGAYITIYNTDLVPQSNYPVAGNAYGKIELSENAFVTVSVQTTQEVEIISETEKSVQDAVNVANTLNNKLIGSLENKKICFYGDSITCLGNDFRTASWQGILKDYFSLKNSISVGIGGTHLIWTPNERYDLSSFTIGNNLPYGATRTQGDSGTIVSMCSWDRIEKTVPTDCDIVFVMGGTNDANTQVSGSTELSASNTTDSIWVSSDAYIGGDYDITTINGAILSAIMKMHVRCPNALIIWCTPLSGRGQTAGENQLNYDSTDRTHDISEAIKSMCGLMSSECFDLFGNSGITPYNRATYLYDTVHPNAEGMKMIGRYFIEKFRALQVGI